MANRRLWALAVLLVAVPACGGKVESTQQGGSGGTSAAGGTSGTGAMGGSGGTGGTSGTGAMGGTGGTSGTGAMGGTGGTPTNCVPGGPCAQEGESCTPAGCCACTYVCKGGIWEPKVCPNCIAPPCPSTPPTDGAPCNSCSDPVGKVCSYASCGPEATCDGQHWHIVIATCPPAQPCDPTTGACPSGELCVHPAGLGNYQPVCEANPCPASEPVSCACAGSLCGQTYCMITSATAVYCDCPNC